MSECDSSRRGARLVPPVIACVVPAVAMAGAYFLERSVVSLPSCLLRGVTGIPCLGCGGTRAFASLAKGEVLAAFQWNPLVVMGVVGVGVWLGGAIGIGFLPERTRERVRRGLGRLSRPALLTGAVFALAHWVYLIVAGR